MISLFDEENPNLLGIFPPKNLSGKTDVLPKDGTTGRLTAKDILEITSAISAAENTGVGRANAFRAMTGRGGTFSGGSVGSSISTALTKLSGTQDAEMLAEIRNNQSQAGLKTLEEHRDWYTTKGYPAYYFDEARDSFRDYLTARQSEKSEQRKVEEFDWKKEDRGEVKSYEEVEENATVLLNTIKDQYTTYKPGGKQLNKSQAIDQLTSGLIKLGITGKDLASYTARLESVIKLTEEMRAGTVNKAAGRYATNIIRGLEDETYDYVQAMAQFNQLTAGLDPSSAGVTAARTALTKHIDAMKYTVETLPVVTGDGNLIFITKKELAEAKPDTYFPPASVKGIPSAMALVAFMVGENEGVEKLPIEFIKKVIQSGFSAIAEFSLKEQEHWNAWVAKYKEVNPDALTEVLRLLGSGLPDSGVSFN